jgi:hypothetical protein
MPTRSYSACASQERRGRRPDQGPEPRVRAAGCLQNELSSMGDYTQDDLRETVKMRQATSRRWKSFGLALAILPCGLIAAAETLSRGSTSETEFLNENEAAMRKMMAGMSIEPSGDVDRDFAAMMIPHHQGAIEMAAAELRHGRNELLRRIAQEIIVDQQQEIAAMQLAVQQPRASSTESPDPPRDLPAVGTPSPHRP